ncbi:hypothetical protein D3C87_1894430 [compost metagenome]
MLPYAASAQLLEEPGNEMLLKDTPLTLRYWALSTSAAYLAFSWYVPALGTLTVKTSLSPAASNELART